MKTQILIAALFFSGLVTAQQKKDSLKVNALRLSISRNRFSKNKETVLFMM
jgi:hypothetical protein